jgi:hypothetical protein
MNESQNVRHHPVEHKAEAVWVVVFAVVGQLLVSRLLAKAAQVAERRDTRLA